MPSQLQDCLNKPGAKLLVERADRLGDTILALPTVEALKDNFPDLTIHMLASPISRELLEIHPKIDKVWLVNWNNGRVKNFWQLAKRLRNQNYDAVICLWENQWMIWLAFAAGIPIRIGEDSNILWAHLLTHTVSQKWRNICIHQADYNMNLLSPILALPEQLNTQLFTDPKWDKKVKEELESVSKNGQKTILIFCGSGGSNLEIPHDVIIAFVDRMIDSHNVLLCYGAVNQDDKITHIKRPNLLNFNRHVSFGELLSLIDAADYYIGPDTGPTHMASFLNKPMVQFTYRRGNFPTRWGPFSDYFRLIRDEYQYDESSDATPITVSSLCNTFYELLNDVSLQKKKSPKKQKRDHIRHSLRIAVICSSRKHYQDIKPDIQKFQQKKLMVFPFYWGGNPIKNIMGLIRFMKRYNITVIQGDIPRAALNLIRFYLKYIKGTIAPVHTSLPLTSYNRARDYIDAYEDAWGVYEGRH